jgi:hypothetical protein
VNSTAGTGLRDDDAKANHSGGLFPEQLNIARTAPYQNERAGQSGCQHYPEGSTVRCFERAVDRAYALCSRKRKTTVAFRRPARGYKPGAKAPRPTKTVYEQAVLTGCRKTRFDNGVTGAATRTDRVLLLAKNSLAAFLEVLSP